MLTIDHPPRSNHNGGTLAFGPDGYLYWSTGDGGGGGDPDENAQDLTSLLGKILRLDVDAAYPYVPASNPFYDDGTEEELIWAYGLRNPWRMAFDRDTGDLYIGDVGQDVWEEIDFQPATSTGGENYGWDDFEADDEFYNPPNDVGPYVRPGKIFPVAVYQQASGLCSVTGGHVYRGTHFPSVVGHYFYGDYCTGKIWGLSYDAGDTGLAHADRGNRPSQQYIQLWRGRGWQPVHRALERRQRAADGLPGPAGLRGRAAPPGRRTSACTTPTIGADLVLSDANRNANGKFDPGTVQLRVDGIDRTSAAQIRVTASHPNSRASLRYVPASDLSLGSHLVTLTYATDAGPLTAAWDINVTSAACTTSAPLTGARARTRLACNSRWSLPSPIPPPRIPRTSRRHPPSKNRPRPCRPSAP